MLHDAKAHPAQNETEMINGFADDLNAAAEDVLEYQVIS
jgi:hypothetical protein